MDQFLATLAANYPIPAQLAQWAFFVFVLWNVLKYVFKVYDYLKDAHRIKENYDETNEKMLGKISTVKNDIERIRTKIGIVKTDVKSMRQDISDLKSSISSLTVTLGENTALLDRKTFNTNSPISLTGEGLSLVKNSGFVDSLKQNKDSVFKLVDEQNFTSKHDLEHFCISQMHKFNGSPEPSVFTPVKDFLYENGEVEELKIITACAIYMRDAYLDEHIEQFDLANKKIQQDSSLPL